MIIIVRNMGGCELLRREAFGKYAVEKAVAEINEDIIWEDGDTIEFREEG